MATKTTKGGAIKEVPNAGDPAFVTLERFETLESSVSDLVSLIKSGALNAPPAATPEQIIKEKEIEKAVPNKYTVNPEWEEMAREIIGEALDHTEIEYAKGGGMKFTLVIKNDFSNAAKDYLERHLVDRRTREIGAEGEAGVKTWCEQVKNNLKRPKPYTS